MAGGTAATEKKRQEQNRLWNEQRLQRQKEREDAERERNAQETNEQASHDQAKADVPTKSTTDGHGTDTQPVLARAPTRPFGPEPGERSNTDPHMPYLTPLPELNKTAGAEPPIRKPSTSKVNTSAGDTVLPGILASEQRNRRAISETRPVSIMTSDDGSLIQVIPPDKDATTNNNSSLQPQTSKRKRPLEDLSKEKPAPKRLRKDAPAQSLPRETTQTSEHNETSQPPSRKLSGRLRSQTPGGEHPMSLRERKGSQARTSQASTSTQRLDTATSQRGKRTRIGPLEPESPRARKRKRGNSEPTTELRVGHRQPVTVARSLSVPVVEAHVAAPHSELSIIAEETTQIEPLEVTPARFEAVKTQKFTHDTHSSIADEAITHRAKEPHGARVAPLQAENDPIPSVTEQIASGHADAFVGEDSLIVKLRISKENFAQWEAEHSTPIVTETAGAESGLEIDQELLQVQDTVGHQKQTPRRVPRRKQLPESVPPPSRPTRRKQGAQTVSGFQNRDGTTPGFLQQTQSSQAKINPPFRGNQVPAETRADNTQATLEGARHHRETERENDGSGQRANTYPPLSHLQSARSQTQALVPTDMEPMASLTEDDGRSGQEQEAESDSIDVVEESPADNAAPQPSANRELYPSLPKFAGIPLGTRDPETGRKDRIYHRTISYYSDIYPAPFSQKAKEHYTPEHLAIEQDLALKARNEPKRKALKRRRLEKWEKRKELLEEIEKVLASRDGDQALAVLENTQRFLSDKEKRSSSPKAH